MHLQKNFNEKIRDLEAQLKSQTDSVSARCAEAEQGREEAERQLAKQQQANQQMQQQVTSLKLELQAAERKACAAAEETAGKGSQLSDTQVSGSSGSD
jgi:predicted RNase H-like nuclease (RuvC/YqgF family)